MEVGVLDGGDGGDSPSVLEQEKGGDKTDGVGIQARGVGYQGLGGVGRELVAGQLVGLGDPWPRLLCWRT